MNTKILVALVIGIALVGLTGAASANPGVLPDGLYQHYCDNIDEDPEPGDYESITETYTFTKTVGGDDLVDIGEVTSGTYFYESPILGYEDPNQGHTTELKGIIENTLVGTCVKVVENCSDPYEATLIQTGKITANLNVPEVKELPEFDLSVEKSQRLIASGQFETYGAMFEDCAEVGANYWDPIRGLDDIGDCGNCHLEERSLAVAGVYAEGDAMFAEVDMGTKSWTSLDAVECVNACEPAVLMDGGSMAYSSFGGESIVPQHDSIITGAGVLTTHGWNSGAGWSHEPPLCP
jgi:hypothetical protein